MKQICCSLWGVLLLGFATNLLAQDSRLGGVQLLPGYTHQRIQGIDSLLGRISKPDGLSIGYEIGHVTQPGEWPTGGSFTDHPKQQPDDQVQWYREQFVNGQPVHLAYRYDNLLLVSFPAKGLNFSVRVRDADEMAEALLMIMTYPGEASQRGDTIPNDGEMDGPSRNLSKANLRDIERIADALTRHAEKLHDEYHRNLESVTHGQKLEADVSKMERIARSLSRFSKAADGSEGSLLRLRADTNNLLLLSWQMDRTIDLTEKWTRDTDAREGLDHVREVVADVIKTTLAIDAFLSVDANVFDGQVARMEELASELHARFHENLEDYEVSDYLDEVLRALEQQVERIQGLTHNQAWNTIDFRRVLDETQAAKRATEEIESLLLEQLSVGVRERHRAGIEQSRDTLSDMLASAQLIEYMIDKQEGSRGSAPTPIAMPSIMSVTNLGPGELRLDFPDGSKVVPPDSSISVSVGSVPVNFVALKNDTTINLQHGRNGAAKFWDVDDQVHTPFSQNTSNRQFILARNRMGYHLEQAASIEFDEEIDEENEIGATSPRAGGSLNAGAPQLEIAECSTFEQQWNDRGSGALMDGAFWRPVMKGYYPVGDLLVDHFENPNGEYTCLVVKDGVTGATQAPVDFKRIWTSAGAEADREGSIWQPIPPEGYVALGCVAQGGYDKPDTDAIRCIRRDLATPATLGNRRWNDQFSGAEANISTYEVVGSDGALAPNSFVAFNSYEDRLGEVPGAYAFSKKATSQSLSVGRGMLLVKVFEVFPARNPEQPQVFFELYQVANDFKIEIVQNFKEVPPSDQSGFQAFKDSIAEALRGMDSRGAVRSRLEITGRVDDVEGSGKKWGPTLLINGFLENSGNRQVLRIRDGGFVAFELSEPATFQGIELGSYPIR